MSNIELLGDLQNCKDELYKLECKLLEPQAEKMLKQFIKKHSATDVPKFTNKNIVLCLVEQDPQIIEDLPDYNNDEEILSLIAQKSVDSLKYAGNRLQTDKNLALRIVGINGLALKHLKTFNSDEEVVLEAIKQNGNALIYASPIFQKRRDMVILSSKTCYKCIMSGFEDDKEVVLNCVKNNGNLLEYVSTRLKEDDDVVDVSINSCALSIIFAHTKYLENRDYILRLMKHSGWYFNIIPEHFKLDREIILEAVQTCEYVLKQLSAEFRDDKEIVKTSVQYYSRTIQFASYRLKRDKEIILTALEDDGQNRVLEHIDPIFLRDVDIAVRAVITHPYNYLLLDEKMLSHPRIVGVLGLDLDL